MIPYLSQLLELDDSDFSKLLHPLLFPWFIKLFNAKKDDASVVAASVNCYIVKSLTSVASSYI